MGDIGLLGMLVLCFGILGWWWFDWFTAGAVAGVVLWIMMKRS